MRRIFLALASLSLLAACDPGAPPTDAAAVDGAIFDAGVDGGAGEIDAGRDASANDASTIDASTVDASVDASSVVDALTLTRDDAHAARAILGPAGGQLVVTTAAGTFAEITVPAGALTTEVEIVATPLLAADPLTGIRALALAPEGQVFLQPITVRLLGGATDDWAFGFRGEGEDPHLIPGRVVVGSDVLLSLRHFSGAGTGAGPLPMLAPSADESRALDAIARIEQDEIAAGGVVMPSRRAAAIRSWLASVPARIDDAKNAAVAASFDALFLRALAEVGELTAQISSADLDADPAFVAEFGPVEGMLLASLREAAAAELQRIRARAVAAADWTIEREIDARLLPYVALFIEEVTVDPLFSSAALARDSNVDVVVDDLDVVPTVGEDVRVTGRVVALFLGNPLPDALVTARATLSGATPLGATSDLVPDAGRLLFDARLDASRMVVTIEALFRGFEPGAIAPSALGVARYEGGLSGLSLTVRGRAADGSVATGGMVTLEAALRVDPSRSASGQTISFALEGPGTLSATSATTDLDGHAQVIFTAPATEGTTHVVASSQVGADTLRTAIDVHVSRLDLTVEPALSIVSGGTEVDLTATLLGDAALVAEGVVWGATAGSVVGTGTTATYTAPTAEGRYQVRATSVADPRSIAIADVVVLGSGRRVTYSLETDPGDGCTNGATIIGVTFTALEGDGSPAPGVTLRLVYDSVVDTLTTNGSGQASVGRRAFVQGRPASVSWIEAGMEVATVDFAAELDTFPGDACRAPCGTTCGVTSIPPEIPGPMPEGFRCECQARGCCASGSGSGYNCYRPSDC